MQTRTRHLVSRNLAARKRLLVTITPSDCINSNFFFRTSQSQGCGVRKVSFISRAFTDRLVKMVSRHNHLLEKIANSPDNGYLHGKELASLSHAMKLYEKKLELEAEENSIRDLLEELGRDLDDDDMEEECMGELERIKSSQEKLEKKIRLAVLPKDENDYHSDAIIEIRAGTGGDEATLFASELHKAYKKTATSMNWEFDTMSESATDLGGIKEVVLSISGSACIGGMMDFSTDDDESANILKKVGPYGLFKYESS